MSIWRKAGTAFINNYNTEHPQHYRRHATDIYIYIYVIMLNFISLEYASLYIQNCKIWGVEGKDNSKTYKPAFWIFFLQLHVGNQTHIDLHCVLNYITFQHLYLHFFYSSGPVFCLNNMLATHLRVSNNWTSLWATILNWTSGSVD